MESHERPAIIYDGAVYCADCLPTGVDVHDDDCQLVSGDSADSTDSNWGRVFCCNCGREHDCTKLSRYRFDELSRRAQQRALNECDREAFGKFADENGLQYTAEGELIEEDSIEDESDMNAGVE